MDGPTIPIDFGQQVETLVRCMYAYYLQYTDILLCVVCVLCLNLQLFLLRVAIHEKKKNSREAAVGCS